MAKSAGARYDLAVLTVIGVEFCAVQRALKIDVRQRNRVDGAIYYKAIVYSQLLQRNFRIIVGCIMEPSQANASAMATKMIMEFDPALIVLLGIGAGMRDKLRIGDVVVPREVADLSVNVNKGGVSYPRPQIKPWPFAVKQMMPGFLLNEAVFHARCKDLLGLPIIPPQEQEAEFAEHVTFTPRVGDSAVGSSDTLLRDPDAFIRMTESHEGIRAAEMEAGGFIKACESHLSPRPWLVVRGISDFGDQFKNDDFHRLAASAAAAWLICFLEDGFDLFNLRPDEDESLTERAEPGTILAQVELVPATTTGLLTPLTADFIGAQIERLARSSTADRLRDLDEIREAWRVGQGEAVLNRVRDMKSREEWLLVDPEVRGKFLRFEASLVLSMEKNVPRAKELALEAATLDPLASTETLQTYIAYHENGTRAALARISAPATQDGWNLRLALLTEEGDWKTVLDEFRSPPNGVQPDAESRRLRALAFLFSNDLPNARAEISRANIEHPKWFNLRFTGAVIGYFESLSPALLARTSKSWPAPTDPSLVRRDHTAVESLKRASQTLEQLLEGDGINAETRRDLEGWLLACLANDMERRNEAQSYCVSLLEHDPKHPVALAWATARGYVSDLQASVEALFEELLPAV